jgi:hypothetical protein
MHAYLYYCPAYCIGRRLQMSHYQFTFDRVFDMSSSQQEVCDSTIKPLYQYASAEGGNATLIFYGQTGTGKTYTLDGGIQWLERKLLEDRLDAKVTFFEIHGKKCFDLLQNRKVIKLMSDENEIVHPVGCRCFHVKEGNCMRGLLQDALELRSHQVTERNPVSSRSHAILNIHFPGSMGTVKMVDLAGSERNYETVKMTPELHRESADINRSLLALKDCFRAYNTLSKGLQHTPYIIDSSSMLKEDGSIRGQQSRRSRDPSRKRVNGEMKSAKVRLQIRAHMLTRVLRDCFYDKKHRTILLACASPTSTDAEHSLNTLNHVSLMNIETEKETFRVPISVPLADPYAMGKLQHKPIHNWTPVDVEDWIATVDEGAYSHIILPPGLTGEDLLRMGEYRLSELFARSQRDARRDEEGQSWTIAAGASASDEELSKALFEAVRAAAADALYILQTNESASNSAPATSFSHLQEENAQSH